jgi:hypothetical protein
VNTLFWLALALHISWWQMYLSLPIVILISAPVGRMSAASQLLLILALVDRAVLPKVSTPWLMLCYLSVLVAVQGKTVSSYTRFGLLQLSQWLYVLSFSAANGTIYSTQTITRCFIASIMASGLWVVVQKGMYEAAQS